MPGGFLGGQLVCTGCKAATDSRGFQQATVARPQVIFINPHPCKGLSPKSHPRPPRPPWAPRITPQPDPRTPSPPIPPGAPVWLTSRVTRGHSGYFFHQAFSINIHNTRRALGAGWRYSLTGAENFFFFPAGLRGAGGITKAAPVFRGDAAGAEGSATNGVGTAMGGTPSCCASKRCGAKRWVLAPRAFP